MKEFSNLGEEIKHTVQDAVDTMNFDQLNKNITDSVNAALYEVRNRLNIDSMSKGASNQNLRDWKVSYHSTKDNSNQASKNNAEYQQTSYQTGSSDTTYRGQSNAQSQTDMWEKRKQAAIDRANQMRRNHGYQAQAARNYNMQQSGSMGRNELIPNPKKIPGRIIGPLLKGYGYTFASLTGLATIILCIIDFSSPYAYLRLPIQILLTIFGAHLLLAISGRRISGRAKRFRQYITYMTGRKFCQIEALAAHTGYSKRFILKDIRKMMQLGMFPQGHIDDKGTCLIFDHETYQQYVQVNSEYERKKQLESQTKKTNKASETPKSSEAKENLKENAELRKTIAEGREYIRQINEANEAIPAIDISEKLSRLEQITSKIFSFVEQHPEQLPELRKFMEYYLPISLKLVNAYKELDAQPVQGENICNSKQEIITTLDTINYAFENLLDSLYESTAMEVSSDISVLEALFAQDGLTKKDFDLK